MVNRTLALIPSSIRDERAKAIGAALDQILTLDPWMACPLALEHTPDVVLWFLAQQFGVTGALWSGMDTPAKKRALIAKALRLQRHRGTPWCVEEVIRLLGYSDAKVLDRQSLLRYDGEAMFNGAFTYDSALPSWAHFRVRVTPGAHSFLESDQTTAQPLAESWAPLRCRFAGWEVRHNLSSVVCHSDDTASGVAFVALGDANGQHVQLVTPWIQQGEKPVVRWRIPADNVTVPIVGRVALIHKDGSEIAAQTVGAVQATAGMVLDGLWHLTDAPAEWTARVDAAMAAPILRIVGSWEDHVVLSKNSKLNKTTNSSWEGIAAPPGTTTVSVENEVASVYGFGDVSDYRIAWVPGNPLNANDWFQIDLKDINSGGISFFTGDQGWPISIDTSGVISFVHPNYSNVTITNIGSGWHRLRGRCLADNVSFNLAAYLSQVCGRGPMNGLAFRFRGARSGHSEQDFDGRFITTTSASRSETDFSLGSLSPNGSTPGTLGHPLDSGGDLEWVNAPEGCAIQWLDSTQFRLCRSYPGEVIS